MDTIGRTKVQSLIGLYRREADMETPDFPERRGNRKPGASRCKHRHRPTSLWCKSGGRDCGRPPPYQM